MDPVTHDLFATKGIEYLLVLGFLALLVPYWLLLERRRSPRPELAAPAPRPEPAVTPEWFRLPDDRLYHQGHTWVQGEQGRVVRVGVDDFAAQMIGEPASLELPPTGRWLTVGGDGWGVGMDGTEFSMRSPVTGQVVGINHRVAEQPELLANDPYGDGWLLRVQVPRSEDTGSNLVGGDLARAWMADVTEGLRAHMGGPLGTLMQDGGVPQPGFGRALAPATGEEDWRDAVSTLLRAPWWSRIARPV